jgi:FixJ family two-component response regulator
MQNQTELFSQFLTSFTDKYPYILESMKSSFNSKMKTEKIDELIEFLSNMKIQLNQFSLFELSLFCTKLEKSCHSIKNNQDEDQHSLSFLIESFAQLPLFLRGQVVQIDQSKVQPPLVYVVDDEPMLLELFEAMLQSLPIRIKTFNNPEKAIDDLLFDRPSLILSDMKMPEMSGTDLLKKIRLLDQAVSFIFISGYINKDNVLEFMNLGVYGVVEKPFKAPQVLALVEKALKNYEILSSYNKSLEQLILQAQDLGSEEIKHVINKLLQNRKKLFQFA